MFGVRFFDAAPKDKKSVRYSTKLILEYSLAGYNVFDTKPPSKSDGLVTIERPLFTQSGALSPYTINKTNDENDQDNWVQVCWNISVNLSLIEPRADKWKAGLSVVIGSCFNKNKRVFLWITLISSLLNVGIN